MLAPGCFRKGGAQWLFQTSSRSKQRVTLLRKSAMKGKILVVDIGGTHVKLMMSAQDKLKFDSGPEKKPHHFVKKFHETAAELKFDAVSIGFPSVVHDGKIVKEPKHLGKGWIGFNFRRTLKKPVRVINDGAM